ncbi:MAG TPA: hypothetical protein VFJ72_10575 [Rubrobacteraceae bacterium]|nr:hypothetical protein [Rubrobacteraceae bacterium]
MTTTANINKMTRTTREIAEVQRDSFEALAENFSDLQRRNIEFAQGGFEFIRLQEDNAKAAREWFANGLKLAKLQQRNVEFTQKWMSGGVELLRDQAEHNRRAVEVFSQSTRKQQENFRALAEEWTGAYRNFFSPFAYAQEGLKAAQQTTQQAVQATQQVAQQGLRVAEETTRKSEQAIRKTQEATREAALQTAVHSALKTANYEDLNVDEVSKKLDGLSAAELKKVREYEKKNKNRETLIEQIDRKLKATS